MKQIFKNNVIKFVIWLVLLFFCFLYIKKYPAEKVAIFSWFDVMIQRAEIVFNKILKTNNADALKSKFEYEQNYDWLIKIAEANWCNDANLIKEMKDTLEGLKNEEMKTIWNNLPWYIRKANEFRNRVYEQCKK